MRTSIFFGRWLIHDWNCSSKSTYMTHILPPHLFDFISCDLTYPQGKVHNPTGAGVRAVSSGVQKKASDAAGKNGIASTSSSSDNKHPDSHGSRPGPHRHHHHVTDGETETQVKEEGSARRNITRKKTDPAVGGNYDSKSKKMGGAG